MKIPFIVLTQSEASGGKLVIQVQSIIAFGNLYGDINQKKSFLQINPDSTKPRHKTTATEDGCYVVNETPEEIMALIDKAQALVHALENG
jgi:hypothetical protein